MAFLWPTANMVQLLVWLQPSFARTHSAHFYMLICFQWAVFKGRVNVFLVRKGNTEKRKREDGAPGRCKCSSKSTWPSTLSSMILTFSTLNSVKQISANNKGALWGSSVLYVSMISWVKRVVTDCSCDLCVVMLYWEFKVKLWSIGYTTMFVWYSAVHLRRGVVLGARRNVKQQQFLTCLF